MNEVTSTALQKFAAVYKEQFERYKLPGDFDRFLTGAVEGKVDIKGPAIKATMKALGIKPTYKALREFFAQDK